MQKKKFIKNMKKKKQAEVSLTKKEKKKIEKENTMLDVIEPFSFKVCTPLMFLNYTKSELLVFW